MKDFAFRSGRGDDIDQMPSNKTSASVSPKLFSIGHATSILAKVNDYDISLRMTNAFNRKYAVHGNKTRAPFGMDFLAFGPPRMYGIMVSGRF